MADALPDPVQHGDRSLPAQRPQVDHDICLKTAQQCCDYYAGIMKQYEKCRTDRHWHEMQQVAETWRSLLTAEAPNESEFVHLKAQVLKKWGESHCGTSWIWMATCIDIWLRSRGRPGLGVNPWYKDRAPTTVRPLW